MVLLTVTPTLIVLQLLPEFFFNSPWMSPVSFPPPPPPFEFITIFWVNVIFLILKEIELKTVGELVYYSIIV